MTAVCTFLWSHASVPFAVSAQCARAGVCSALCHLGMHPDTTKVHVGWKESSLLWYTYYHPGLALRPFNFLFVTDALFYYVQEWLMDISRLYTL